MKINLPRQCPCINSLTNSLGFLHVCNKKLKNTRASALVCLLLAMALFVLELEWFQVISIINLISPYY